MVIRFFLLYILLLSATYTSSQVNFRQEIEADDPVHKDSMLTLEDKLIIHQKYLDQAIANSDTLRQIYGNIYLFIDYVLAEKFDLVDQYIIEAKSLANQSGNAGWKGWTTFREGVAYVRTRNEERAIAVYEDAIPLCQEAGDSLCVAECYEQLCILYGLEGDYDKAQVYFDKAMPLLQVYGEAKNLCTAYSNYGSLVSMMGKPKEAVAHFKKSLEFCSDIKKYDSQASTMNNLAQCYFRLEDYDKAIALYDSAIVFNKKHQFDRVRIKNYMGLYYAYGAKNEYKTASEYLIKRYTLQDSLMGAEVQEKLSTLQTKYENQQKELALEKSKSQLLAAKNRIRMVWMLLAFLTLLGAIGIWYNYNKRRQLKAQVVENKENLNQLTQTLIRKNAGIKSLEDKIYDLKTKLIKEEREHVIEDNIFDQTILSADDWSAFKIKFDKAHPGFILRLRKKFSLSEAEERLFILLKLNLTRNEIAAILGVTTDTVKKTRNRLRKRLELTVDDSLDEFCETF